MIKYIGSKRTLLPLIVQAFQAAEGISSVADLFSGTSRVGHALKGAGFRVFANDHNAYASTLGRCYVQANREDHILDAKRLIAELNALKGRPGYVTETFCERARYFQPKNGERIDAIREEIARKSLDPETESILLTSLMEAADRVDSTAGVQMAYMKKWAPRSNNDLSLRVPAMLERPKAGKCIAQQMDAIEAARALDADAVYIDPPYNQHSYLGNYHIWESLVLWDKPEVYGVACKRIDCRLRQSLFNSKRNFRRVFTDLLQAIQTKYIVISFNNEGYIDRESMEDLLLSCYGEEAQVIILEKDYKRYVGAQIGIHNLRGEKVGRISHLKNKEFLYIISRGARVDCRRFPRVQEGEAMLF